MANQEKIPAHPDTFAVMNRYRDAYKVADSALGSANTLKNIGIFIMLLGVVGGFMLAAVAQENSFLRQSGELTLIASVVIGAIIVLWGYSMYARGVHMAAQAQATLAMLDNAVSTSPFLANEHRAKVLNLPTAVSVTYLVEKAKELAAS
jgi:uncharacterized membrane protein YeaQ/YmgE (transglycosylase-associated protein family)